MEEAEEDERDGKEERIPHGRKLCEDWIGKGHGNLGLGKMCNRVFEEEGGH